MLAFIFNIREKQAYQSRNFTQIKDHLIDSKKI
jgi:hypothetical protein